MSEEVALHEPQHPVGGNPDHLRLSIDECWRVAQFLSASGMFQNGRNTMKPEECMAIIMVGQGLGIAPGVAMMNFHLIEGRPEMSAFLQSYFIKASGKYEYRAKHTRDAEGDYVACQIDVIEVASGEVVGESLFTLRDAQNAGLIRPGGNYKKYAGNMLLARAMSNAMAWHAPDSVPIRIYAEGETSGRDAIGGAEQGVVAVEGEAQVRPEQVEDAVSQALEADEEVIEDAEVVDEGFNPATEVLPDPVEPPTLAEDRFSPQAVETRLREDLPKLSDADKQLVKTAVTSARPAVKWGYSGITSLIVKAGFTDVNTWISMLLRPGTRQTTPAGASQPGLTPVGDSLPEGVTGAKTGSQTAPTVSDAQVRMLHARMSACQFDEQEKRYFLQHYADAASTRDVKKSDVDDLLQVLKDIEAGDEATRNAYLGGAAN